MCRVSMFMGLTVYMIVAGDSAYLRLQSFATGFEHKGVHG